MSNGKLTRRSWRKSECLRRPGMDSKRSTTYKGRCAICHKVIKVRVKLVDVRVKKGCERWTVVK